jgi:hypothetical protein
MADTFKQLRSMILLELCCPPLPVMAQRQESGEPFVTNTHDMISVFMITAFRRQDGVENKKRKEKQIEIERNYLDGLEDVKTPIQAYDHMKKFSVDYLATYLLSGAGFTKQDIQILPSSQISPSLMDEIRSYTSALKMMTMMIASADEEKCDVSSSSNQSMDSLFMSCISSAIHNKQQRIVSQPILECVGKDIGEESHNPYALKPGVEVL